MLISFFISIANLIAFIMAILIDIWIVKLAQATRKRLCK